MRALIAAVAAQRPLGCGLQPHLLPTGLWQPVTAAADNTTAAPSCCGGMPQASSSWQHDLLIRYWTRLDISRVGVGEGGWLEGWLGCLLRLGGSERPCNTCNALPCISVTFPQNFSLIPPLMRHRQPHTFQQAPPATSPMRDMPRWPGNSANRCCKGQGQPLCCCTRHAIRNKARPDATL